MQAILSHSESIQEIREKGERYLKALQSLSEKATRCEETKRAFHRAKYELETAQKEICAPLRTDYNNTRCAVMERRKRNAVETNNNGNPLPLQTFREENNAVRAVSRNILALENELHFVTVFYG